MKKTTVLVLSALCMVFQAFAAEKKTAAKSCDIDLTRMSATMVYAKVFDMIINPDSYEGKKIRMKGTFAVFEHAEAGKTQRSFACIIKDATACCAQGMEFSLAGKPSYPEDYPKQDAPITVCGTFRQTEQDGLTRILLTDSRIE